jgi:taurine--2-oxoglutarate transaminase
MCAPNTALSYHKILLVTYSIIMVCDEVMCGLGRCGEYFACQVYDVVPDLLVMAKGLTSAYLPLGAVAMSPQIASAFDDKPFPGGLTYNGYFDLSHSQKVPVLFVFPCSQL